MPGRGLLYAALIPTNTPLKTQHTTQSAGNTQITTHSAAGTLAAPRRTDGPGGVVTNGMLGLGSKGGLLLLVSPWLSPCHRPRSSFFEVRDTVLGTPFTQYLSSSGDRPQSIGLLSRHEVTEARRNSRPMPRTVAFDVELEPFGPGRVRHL
jgi:hypothetical protein